MTWDENPDLDPQEIERRDWDWEWGFYRGGVPEDNR